MLHGEEHFAFLADLGFVFRGNSIEHLPFEMRNAELVQCRGKSRTYRIFDAAQSIGDNQIDLFHTAFLEGLRPKPSARQLSMRLAPPSKTTSAPMPRATVSISSAVPWDASMSMWTSSPMISTRYAVPPSHSSKTTTRRLRPSKPIAAMWLGTT